MDEARDLLLTDALTVAIKAEKNIIKLKIVIAILCIIILGLAGGLIWTAIF